MKEGELLQEALNASAAEGNREVYIYYYIMMMS